MIVILLIYAQISKDFEFSDVTLAYKDYKQIGAHRVVLVKAKATLGVVWTLKEARS